MDQSGPKILDGRLARAELKKRLAARLGALKKRGARPVLAIVQAGDRPDTAAYVGAKKKFAAEIGVKIRHERLAEGVSRREIVGLVKKLNDDASVPGIIIQLPLPDGLRGSRDGIINAVCPAKDVDGLTAESVARWSAGDPDAVWPATARGVGELLGFYGLSLDGKKVCVIGRSALVGAPVAAMCRDKGAVVTVCHSGTEDLKKETLAADVIISAAGKPGLVTAGHVKPGQVVVDVGLSKAGGGGKLVGDADFEAVSAILGPAGAITPAPGGVGPMTVLALFENLANAAEHQTKHFHGIIHG